MRARVIVLTPRSVLYRFPPRIYRLLGYAAGTAGSYAKDSACRTSACRGSETPVSAARMAAAAAGPMFCGRSGGFSSGSGASCPGSAARSRSIAPQVFLPMMPSTARGFPSVSKCVRWYARTAASVSFPNSACVDLCRYPSATSASFICFTSAPDAMCLRFFVNSMVRCLPFSVSF